jgi:GntR family transcriptional regulator
MSDRPGEPGPKYRQIAEELREQIASGALEVGGKMPTKDRLAKLYDVALATVTRALEELQREGLIRSDQGAGTWILKKPSAGPSPEFTAIMERLDGMDGEIRQLREQVERLESE